MINICYIIDTIETKYAGTEKQLLEIIRLLDRSRINPSLVCLRPSRWLSQNEIGCPVHIVPLGSLLSFDLLRSGRAFADFCRRHNIQVVQTFFRDANIAGVLWAHRAQVPVIIASRRSVGRRYWHNLRLITVFRFLERYTHYYICNSQAVAEESRIVERIRPDKLAVITNGLHVHEFIEPNREKVEQIRKDWGFSAKTMVVGTVANLRPVKNLEFLVRAARRLTEMKEDVGFVVLGEGYHRPHLEAMIRDLDLEDKIVLPGHSGKVGQELYAIDIAVSTSHSESFSNSIMEYMAAGRAIVASDVGGNSELIKTNGTGYLYPAEDLDAFVEKVLRLADSPGVRSRLGHAARREAESRFSFESVLKQLEDLYESLLHRSTARISSA